MKFRDTLENLLAQKSKIKILRFLFKNKLELTGREMARSIKMDHKTCHRSLKELSEQGVVLVNNTGGGVLYKINEKNLLVKELLYPLFEKESRLIKVMSQSLINKLKIPLLSAVLFGSIVQGKERPTSDVDLLLIVSDKKRKERVKGALSDFEYDFICEFGNMLSPIILTLAELRNKIKTKNRLIAGILRMGDSIAGKSVEELKNLVS